MQLPILMLHLLTAVTACIHYTTTDRGSKAYTVGRDESGAPTVTYIETVTVTPGTPHHGTGRYRLALCAGDSDITEFRVTFLNRACRRQDKEISVPPLQVCAYSY
jgi:hypothetical protein